MKTKILVTLLLMGLFFVNGCAIYKNEAQYDKGEWYGLIGSEAVAHIKSDKLAFTKLNAAPVQTKIKNDVQQGYEGLVANLSSYNRYNFKLFGPETKSYLLGPGERVTDYLVPGKYTCVVFQGSYQVGSWSFNVGPQQSTFMNEKHHWYVYADR